MRITLAEGCKEPDYSIYDPVDPENPFLYDSSANLYPTIAFEVAYSEKAEKLSRDAARLLLLSNGHIQLVVALISRRIARLNPSLGLIGKWLEWTTYPMVKK